MPIDHELLATLRAAAAARGLCWSIGTTRLADFECRIWPRKQEMRTPVIIVGGTSWDDAIQKALTRLGDQVPRP